MWAIALGPRVFKWKMLSLSGPNALLFLQLLIALVTMSAVKVTAIFIGFLLVSLVTNRVSLEDECLPSFEVVNCLLNLADSCVDDENEIPLKEIASFSAVRFALPSIPLIVLHSMVIYVLWSMFSTKSLRFSRLCSQMRFWMSIQSWQFRLGTVSFAEVVSSGHHVQYLCWYRFLVESLPSSRDVVRCCFE